MIQEVEGGGAEFETLPLGHLERLEHCQITVEVCRSMNIGELIPAIGPWRRHSEAGHVDVLMRFQVSCGIASNRRLKLNASRAQPSVVRNPAALQPRRIIRIIEVAAAEP